MQKILVLGGNGFLGKNIVKFLDGKYDVLSCDKYGSEIIQKNLLRDPYKENLDINFDVCVHLIDNKVPLIDFQNYEEMLANHLSWNGKKHFVLMSSAVIYANPASDYGKRKKMLEDFWSSFCERKGINFTILRLFNTYGPYQKPFTSGGLIANIIFNHLLKEPTEIQDMDAKRTFVYSKDVARIFAHVIENNIYGLHDIAGGNTKSIKELLNLLKNHVMKDEILVKDLKRQEKIFCPTGNSSLISKIQETDFIKSLQETYMFYLENKDEIYHCLQRRSE